MHLKIAGEEIRGIAFDLEGTILNLEQQHWQAHALVAKKIGLVLDFDDPKTFINIPHLIGGPDRAIMDDLLQLAQKRGVLKKKNTLSVEEMLDLDNSEYHRLLDQLEPKHFRPRPGFLTFLRYLINYRFPITIGSLTKTNEAYVLLGKSGLAQYFQHIDLTFLEDVQKPKPNPDVYLSTAAKMHIWPSQQLVFEDSHNGVKAATAAGSLAIAIPVVNNSDTNKRLKEAGASYILASWREVHPSLNLSLNNTDLT